MSTAPEIEFRAGMELQEKRLMQTVQERLKREIRRELEGISQIEEMDLQEYIDQAIRRESRQQYLPLKKRLELKTRLYDSFRRLDILQELVDDPDVTEIMVNGRERIFIEKKGRISQWDKSFDQVEELEDLIQQIVSRINRSVNVSHPIADARLEDGSRVHVVLPPVALDGPVVTIRKFPEPITAEKLISIGSLTQEAADFLKRLVCAGYNLFICGGTGSGKTTSTKRAGAGSWIQKERKFHHSTGRQWRYSLSHDRGSRSG